LSEATWTRLEALLCRISQTFSD